MTAIARERGARHIAVGFLVYNPGESVVRRIEMAHAAGFFLYIFDNSPQRETVRRLSRRLPETRYITCGRNVGVGCGLASICAQAYYDDFLALLFFDQDTVFERQTLEFIEEFYVSNPALGATHSAVVFNAKQAAKCGNSPRFAHRDVLLAISSGSLFFLDNLRRLNWHNPSYFVDCVDYEFCLNSSNNGLKVGKCSVTPGFDHDTEQADATYAVFGKQRRLRRYSAARIADTTVASARLLYTSLTSGNVAFATAIIRSFLGYLLWQVVCRVVRSPAQAR